MGLEPVHVVAGAVFDAGGRVLIAQRPPGKHMAGGWEFPGGKLKPNEPPFEGLCRELKEELGIAVRGAEPVIVYPHDYPDRQVLLDLWRITHYEGEPTSNEGQPLRWVPLSELAAVGLLEADRPMIAALHARYLIAGT